MLFDFEQFENAMKEMGAYRKKITFEKSWNLSFAYVRDLIVLAVFEPDDVSFQAVASFTSRSSAGRNYGDNIPEAFSEDFDSCWVNQNAIDFHSQVKPFERYSQVGVVFDLQADDPLLSEKSITLECFVLTVAVHGP